VAPRVLNVDDEGQPTQETVLIENGILKGYLSDKLSSKLMGLADTGNGRRESYEHIPMPRMTNTYMLAGQDDPGDIIRSVKNGVYAVNFGGGQVDITNGKFVSRRRKRISSKTERSRLRSRARR